MIEVFITDIQTKIQAERLSSTIQNENAQLMITYDFDETGFTFPCGHTILRVEGSNINPDKILATVKNQGFNCEILEDKICIQKEML